jgi:O-acetylserine/cysteine efflux transporter
MTTNRRLVFAALVGAGVLWGTTVPLSKVALGWLPPAWLAFARFALAAAVLLAANRSRLRAAASPVIVINGAVGYGGSVLLQNIGIERTSVTHAALLIGATPVIIAIIAAVLRHSVARPLAWVGFALSLAGVGSIAGGQGRGSSLAGDGLVLASLLISAGFTVCQARTLRGRDPIAVTGLQLLSAAVVVLPVALVTEHHAAGPASPGALLATIGLVVAGTILPMTLFAFGQSRVSADVAGAFLNLEPLVGAVMGMALFAEPAGAVQLAGGAAIAAGIGLSSFQAVRGGRRARASAASAVGAGDAGAQPVGASVAASGAEVRVDPATTKLLAPGEAPSLVKRTRYPPPRPGGDARRRRRLFRPSVSRPAARSSTFRGRSRQR